MTRIRSEDRLMDMEMGKSEVTERRSQKMTLLGVPCSQLPVRAIIDDIEWRPLQAVQPRGSPNYSHMAKSRRKTIHWQLNED